MVEGVQQGPVLVGTFFTEYPRPAGAGPPHKTPPLIPSSHRRRESGASAEGIRPQRHAPTAPSAQGHLRRTGQHPSPTYGRRRILPMRPPRTPSNPRDPPGVEKGMRVGDNEWAPEDRLLWGNTSEGTTNTFLEAAATTYPRPPGDTRRGLHALLVFHSWKHHHTTTFQPFDHDPQRWTPKDDASTTITIQQDPENPTGYHLIWSDPAPHPPASPTLHDIFATISTGPQEAKAPQQPDDEMPQAPPPRATQERPGQEPLAHPITNMELPLQHRTTPDRNGFRNMPRKCAIHNGTLRWDEIIPGLQAIRFYSISKPSDTWTPPADRHHLLLTIQGDASITPTEGDPITAAPAHIVHIPPQKSSAPMTVHPVPTALQAIVITYPSPNDHTHTWHHRAGDLLQEHLGLTRTHHTLHPVQGNAHAPHGIDAPEFWASATPKSPQATEDIRTSLSIQQAQTQTPHRNTQRGYTIWSAYQDQDTLSPQPGPPKP